MRATCEGAIASDRAAAGSPGQTSEEATAPRTTGSSADGGARAFGRVDLRAGATVWAAERTANRIEAQLRVVGGDAG